MSEEQGSESAVSRSQSVKEEEMAEEKEAPRKVSRRQFVKGAAVGGAGVAAAGVLASCAPAATPTTAPEAAPTCPPATECAPCPTPWLPEKWDEEADVVIVGFGGAGANAAIAGYDAGAETLILEVAPEGREGGNTKCTGAGMTHAYDKGKYLVYLKKLCRGATPEEYLEDWAEVETGLLDWLDYLGIEYMQIRHDYGHFFTTTVGGVPGVPESGISFDSGIDQYQSLRPDGTLVAAGELFLMFKDHVEERGIPVLYETRATELIQEPATEEILGVKATQAGKEIYVKARRGVILACGGYENNPELQDSHVYPGVRIYPAGNPYNLGDGVYMAQAVGADIFHMAGVEYYGYGVLPTEHDAAIPLSLTKLGNGIIVNKYGKRIYNEDKKLSHTRTFHALDFDGYPDDPSALNDYVGIPSYLIFDEAKRLAGPLRDPTSGHGPTGWLEVHGLYWWSEDNMEEIESGLIKKADTIKELAENSGIDPAALEDTVNKWNGYCATGEDLQFGRAKDAMLPIEVPPYYAMEMTPCFLNTQGGPKHSNKDGKVLDREDKPIARLYAAGECGSVYSLMYHGSGNVAEAVMVGRLAGENAAALEPWG